MYRSAARTRRIEGRRAGPAPAAPRALPQAAQWSLSGVPVHAEASAGPPQGGPELAAPSQQAESGPPAPQPAGVDPSGTVRPQAAEPSLMDRLRKAAEKYAADKLNEVAARPGTGAKFSLAGCPPSFCNPFRDVERAKADLAEVRPILLAGISAKINPRVEPLWAAYLNGGSPVQDLTAVYADDFTASETTEATSRFLYNALRRDVRANVGALLGAAARTSILFNPRLATELAAIDTPGNPAAMNFDKAREIPGNIAGAIGKDQASNAIGAQPSSFNDARRAGVWAELERTPSGVRVTPSIGFAVWDTVDLCPGNCGGENSEQVATVPMSRFEATGLAGDVPFVIRFPAPAAATPPFEVPDPAGAPPPGPAPPSGSGEKAAGDGLPGDPTAMAMAAVDPKRAGEAVAGPGPAV